MMIHEQRNVPALPPGPGVDGISDSAYEALREIYGTDRAMFAAAYTHGSKSRHGLRTLANKHRIDPDAA